ncbi:hypothetical protein RJ639_034427 [Escallonia herrerae]|uniref:Uncharacterized protein n=1 Tax=Escallonia herrerae TaxID=1293975 RepID=A0AA89BE68_9ASTE|nr:hypothetical protein RJ639_034427 [Escallonia herrerae]
MVVKVAVEDREMKGRVAEVATEAAVVIEAKEVIEARGNRMVARGMKGEVVRVEVGEKVAIEVRARRSQMVDNKGGRTLRSSKNLLFLQAYRALYQACPYGKFAHHTANKALFEALGEKECFHVIDLDLAEGYKWPAFMYDMATRPGELNIIEQCSNERTFPIESSTRTKVEEHIFALQQSRQTQSNQPSKGLIQREQIKEKPSANMNSNQSEPKSTSFLKKWNQSAINMGRHDSVHCPNQLPSDENHRDSR